MLKGNSFALNCTVLSSVMGSRVEFGLPDTYNDTCFSTDQTMGMILTEEICVIQSRTILALSNFREVIVATSQI